MIKKQFTQGEWQAVPTDESAKNNANPFDGNVYEGKIVAACAECRKQENGQFKYPSK